MPRVTVPPMGPYAKWVAGFLTISTAAFSLIENLARPELSNYDSLSHRTIFDLSVISMIPSATGLKHRVTLPLQLTPLVIENSSTGDLQCIDAIHGLRHNATCAKATTVEIRQTNAP
jgi:hypothetical protein